LHLRTATTLTTSTHLPPLAVLDQEDLTAQGIDLQTLVSGARQVAALGSCTANATTAAMSCLGLGDFERYTAALGRAPVAMTDAVAAEEAAICFYHRCTYETGTPATEWPTVDCGSSGPYIVQELEALGVIAGAQIAHGPTNIASLLQSGPVLMGSPWFQAWETPGALGMIDGDGSADAVQAAVGSGVAGGHETLLFGIEAIELTPSGLVTPAATIIVGRNSWSRSWGDDGNYRLHLSTLAMLGAYCDFRQLA
jgi:hypothetical protein